jgi:hypothetical protein
VWTLNEGLAVFVDRHAELAIGLDGRDLKSEALCIGHGNTVHGWGRQVEDYEWESESWENIIQPGPFA